MIQPALRPLCGLEPETVGHILWTCIFASDVWFLCSMRLQKSSLTDHNFAGIAPALFTRLARTDFLFFAYVCVDFYGLGGILLSMMICLHRQIQCINKPFKHLKTIRRFWRYNLINQLTPLQFQRVGNLLLLIWLRLSGM